MIRTWLLLVPLLGATGCIVYDERYHDGECRGCVDDDPSDEPGPNDEPPPDDGPRITDDLALTVAEGKPGESVLSMLIPVDPSIDLSSVVTVSFARDVLVLDAVPREYEVVLLLGVADEAPAGDVEVSVETTSGAGWVLGQTFEILEADEAPACNPTGTGGTTTGGTTGTADTGCL